MFGSSRFLNGHNHKTTPTSNLDDYSDKFGIDSAKVGVVSVACDFDVLIAFLFFGLNNLENFSAIR